MVSVDFAELVHRGSAHRFPLFVKECENIRKDLTAATNQCAEWKGKARDYDVQAARNVELEKRCNEMQRANEVFEAQLRSAISDRDDLRIRVMEVRWPVGVKLPAADTDMTDNHVNLSSSSSGVKFCKRISTTFRSPTIHWSVQQHFIVFFCVARPRTWKILKFDCACR